ncbi:hypothetical protein NPIL_177871 [Nephila pilipes]|uniref:Uncharacterized protein n=1 Tax=Nephila pilipes TaxID=299642 RepID=A0A8X6TPW2_NEPPI|nr:hypothetical protein NPIL_177871 [Nephila pilipes]
MPNRDVSTPGWPWEIDGLDRPYMTMKADLSLPKGSKRFLDTIVIGDETWIHYFSPETKCSSLEWKHPTSPTRTLPSAGKVMMTLFFAEKLWCVQSSCRWVPQLKHLIVKD